MCTAMSLKTNKQEVIFGRTMDFSYELDPEIYIIPKNYEWANAFKTFKYNNQYKIIGTGQKLDKVILVDGINEKGLGVAALYFQGEAYYSDDENKRERPTIGSYEVVNFLLGHCQNILEVMEVLNKVEIIGAKDEITNVVAPLHWFVVDSDDRCLTIEQTKEGLHFYDNPVKVLSNSPSFEWHITNLSNYLSISNHQIEEDKIGNLKLKPFGQGGGTFGLPGDYTSPSRFIRVVYQKHFTKIPKEIDDVINTCFNIMKTVTIPKGVVMTSRETYDYTQYVVFMNVKTGDYYFNTYNNNQILKVNINDMIIKEITSLGKLRNKLEIKKITTS